MLRWCVAFVTVLVLAAAPVVAAQTEPAGSKVDITQVERPDTVVADKSFPLTVELVNRQSAEQQVFLFTGVYTPHDGTPCGPVTDDRFRGFIHRVQPSFRLQPNAAATWPLASDPLPWWQLANASVVREGGPLQLCVFAASSDSGPGATLTFFDFFAFNVTARAVNNAPQAEFAFTPARPNATERVAFKATVSDGDDDALTATWDFGRFTTKGRANATGLTASHAFYPAGVYTVTLTVTDGFDTTRVAKEVTVAPEPDAQAPAVVPTEAPKSRLPAPAAVAVLALAALVAVMRRPSER